MIEKPFKEFKCKEHGFGYLKRCTMCVTVNENYYQYHELPLIELKEHQGEYLFPLCKICKMRYVHDMNHSGVSAEVWAKEWEKILIK